MRSLVGFLLIYGLALPDGANASELFISNEKDNSVTVIDSETLKPIKVIKTGARPRGIRITPDFKWVLVCAGDADAIDVIDTTKLEVVRSIPTLADPEYLEV
jgi:YVTN family beta-propeller protein